MGYIAYDNSIRDGDDLCTKLHFCLFGCPDMQNTGCSAPHNCALSAFQPVLCMHIVFWQKSHCCGPHFIQEKRGSVESGGRGIDSRW